MSDEGMKAVLARMAAQIDDLQKNQPQRVNGIRGFAAEKLKLNIGSVALVLGSLASAVWLVSTKLNAIENRLIDAGSDRWRGSHQREWAHRLADQNRELKVPDVDAVRHGLAE